MASGDNYRGAKYFRKSVFVPHVSQNMGHKEY